MALPFKNDDARLRAEVDRVMAERIRLGLDGLVGGLEYVVVNVEPGSLGPAANEFVRFCGHEFGGGFTDRGTPTCVLTKEGSPDFVFTERPGGQPNPFAPFNTGPKADRLPNTRLETFVFKCPQLERFVDIQRGRGMEFLTDGIIETDKWRFIQTKPSRFTGNSVGYVQWLDGEGAYRHSACADLDLDVSGPDLPLRANVYELDHTATRVRAEERDQAIIEFMEWTNYKFEFAIYVDFLNSITNVARLSAHDFAMVFTSGIEPFQGLGKSGPTETYIHNYNTRVHHLAFRTENIEETYSMLVEDGMGFLVELVGGPDEGLHQTFTEGFKHTMLVNEYIHRYGDFDGFFTQSNVTLLTKATEKQ